MASNEISIFLFKKYNLRLLAIPFIRCLFLQTTSREEERRGDPSPHWQPAPTVYTSAERQMADHLASNQFVTGIEGGFESDGKNNLIINNVNHHFIYQYIWFSCFVNAHMSTKFEISL